MPIFNFLYTLHKVLMEIDLDLERYSITDSVKWIENFVFKRKFRLSTKQLRKTDTRVQAFI